MISNELINQILDIKESYKAPDKMMELMMNCSEKEKTFKKFLNKETDLSYEWFQGYFEAEHADRKEKKQDFTPNSVSELGAMILGKSDQYFEATVGTGGMMIQFWNKNPDAYFEVEELSDRAIPFLLFNMSIRGMNGLVKHGDSLRQEFFEIYELTRKGEFSEIKRR